MTREARYLDGLAFVLTIATRTHDDPVAALRAIAQVARETIQERAASRELVPDLFGIAKE